MIWAHEKLASAFALIVFCFVIVYFFKRLKMKSVSEDKFLMGLEIENPQNSHSVFNQDLKNEEKEEWLASSRKKMSSILNKKREAIRLELRKLVVPLCTLFILFFMQQSYFQYLQNQFKAGMSVFFRKVSVEVVQGMVDAEKNNKIKLYQSKAKKIELFDKNFLKFRLQSVPVQNATIALKKIKLDNSVEKTTYQTFQLHPLKALSKDQATKFVFMSMVSRYVLTLGSLI